MGGFLEVAAEQAAEARDALFHENMRMKGLLLSVANELMRLMHTARSIATEESVDEVRVVLLRGATSTYAVDASHQWSRRRSCSR